MNPHLKKLLIFLGLLLIIWVVQLPFGSWDKQLNQRLSAQLGGQGQIKNLKVLGSKLQFPLTLRFNSVELDLPVERIVVPLKFINLTVHPILSELASLKGNVDGDGTFLGGTVKFNSVSELFGDTGSINVNFSELQLKELPLLASLGVSGHGNGVFRGITKNGAQGRVLSRSNFELNFAEVSFSGGQVPGIPIPLPSLYNGEIKVTGGITPPSSLPSVEFSLNCNLGKLEGKSDGTVLNADLELSEAGSKELGGYLGLAAGSTELSDRKRWQISAPRDLKRISVKPK